MFYKKKITNVSYISSEIEVDKIKNAFSIFPKFEVTYEKRNIFTGKVKLEKEISSNVVIFILFLNEKTNQGYSLCEYALKNLLKNKVYDILRKENTSIKKESIIVDILNFREFGVNEFYVQIFDTKIDNYEYFSEKICKALKKVFLQKEIVKYIDTLAPVKFNCS